MKKITSQEIGEIEALISEIVLTENRLKKQILNHFKCDDFDSLNPNHLPHIMAILKRMRRYMAIWGEDYTLE